MTIADMLIQRGIEKGIVQTTINMLKKGVSIADVTEYTDLSIEEVEKLKKQIILH